MNLNRFRKILSSVPEIRYIVRIQKISQVNNGTIILKNCYRHQLLVQKVKKTHKKIYDKIIAMNY